MSAQVRMALLVTLSLAQLGAASWSIARYEITLRSGAVYRIRTVPVDPADPFRGRYVAVQPSIAIPKPIPPETEELLRSIQSENTAAYVRLEAGPDGFARAAAIVRDRPGEGDYLEIDEAWPTWHPRPEQPSESEMTGYTLRFSFDRYYMNEAAAPAAQDRYFQAARRNADPSAWLTVRVRNGLGVIEGLFVDGVPIEQLVRQ